MKNDKVTLYILEGIFKGNLQGFKEPVGIIPVYKDEEECNKHLEEPIPIIEVEDTENNQLYYFSVGALHFYKGIPKEKFKNFMKDVHETDLFLIVSTERDYFDEEDNVFELTLSPINEEEDVWGL